MLFFTDTTAPSLLQLAEHLRQHEDYGRPIYTREPDGSFRESRLPLLVVDTNRLFSDEDPLEIWRDAVDAIAPLKEIVLAIGVIAPWEQAGAQKALEDLVEMIEKVRDDLAWPEFSATWYYPAENTEIPRIAETAGGLIRTLPNLLYKKVADPIWRRENRALLETIEMGILRHQFADAAISPQLEEMFRELIKAAEEA